MSQKELGEKIGVHKNLLGKYEREEVKPSVIFPKSTTTKGVDLAILQRVITIQSSPD
ncbi:MAG: helix-turn-helix transcriptional regulator [Bacteroidota bacterium]